MEFRFIPSAVESGEMDGHVMIRMPSYDEKMELMDIMDIEVDEDGKVDEKVLRKHGLKAMRRVGARAKEFINSVDLTRKSDGFRFQTYEQLNYDSDGHTVINEVAGKLISKMNLGKG